MPGINCPHCGLAMPIIQELIGKSVRCPECNGSFRMSTWNETPDTPRHSLPIFAKRRSKSRHWARDIRLTLRIGMLIATALWLALLIWIHAHAPIMPGNEGISLMTTMFSMTCPTVVYFVVVGVMLVTHFAIAQDR